MILVLEEGITQDQKSHLRHLLRKEGYIVREILDNGQCIIGAIGETTPDIDFFQQLPGVAKAIPISTTFKLVSRQMHPKDTLVQVGDVVIGGERIVVIAGPCA
ncbi:MAG: hypothetical protein QGG48_13260, partial [Desulfatiglandales bacterium]|nr:hypothetical protein [Desulfatiglandales bacterium]